MNANRDIDDGVTEFADQRKREEVEREFRADPSVFDYGLGRRFFGLKVLELSFGGAYRADDVRPFVFESGSARVQGELRSTMHGSPVPDRPCILSLRWDLSIGLNDSRIQLLESV